eukprot:g4143.t1
MDDVVDLTGLDDPTNVVSSSNINDVTNLTDLQKIRKAKRQARRKKREEEALREKKKQRILQDNAAQATDNDVSASFFVPGASSSSLSSSSSSFSTSSSSSSSILSSSLLSASSKSNSSSLSSTVMTNQRHRTLLTPTMKRPPSSSQELKLLGSFIHQSRIHGCPFISILPKKYRKSEKLFPKSHSSLSAFYLRKQKTWKCKACGSKRMVYNSSIIDHIAQGKSPHELGTSRAFKRSMKDLLGFHLRDTFENINKDEPSVLQELINNNTTGSGKATDATTLIGDSSSTMDEYYQGVIQIANATMRIQSLPLPQIKSQSVDVPIDERQNGRESFINEERQNEEEEEDDDVIIIMSDNEDQGVTRDKKERQGQTSTTRVNEKLKSAMTESTSTSIPVTTQSQKMYTLFPSSTTRKTKVAKAFRDDFETLLRIFDLSETEIPRNNISNRIPTIKCRRCKSETYLGSFEVNGDSSMGDTERATTNPTRPGKEEEDSTNVGNSMGLSPMTSSLMVHSSETSTIMGMVFVLAFIIDTIAICPESRSYHASASGDIKKATTLNDGQSHGKNKGMDRFADVLFSKLFGKQVNDDSFSSSSCMSSSTSGTSGTGYQGSTNDGKILKKATSIAEKQEKVRDLMMIRSLYALYLLFGGEGNHQYGTNEVFPNAATKNSASIVGAAAKNFDSTVGAASLPFKFGTNIFEEFTTSQSQELALAILRHSALPEILAKQLRNTSMTDMGKRPNLYAMIFFLIRQIASSPLTMPLLNVNLLEGEDGDTTVTHKTKGLGQKVSQQDQGDENQQDDQDFEFESLFSLLHNANKGANLFLKAMSSVIDHTNNNKTKSKTRKRSNSTSIKKQQQDQQRRNGRRQSSGGQEIDGVLIARLLHHTYNEVLAAKGGLSKIAPYEVNGSTTREDLNGNTSDVVISPSRIRKRMRVTRIDEDLEMIERDTNKEYIDLMGKHRFSQVASFRFHQFATEAGFSVRKNVSTQQ